MMRAAIIWSSLLLAVAGTGHGLAQGPRASFRFENVPLQAAIDSLGRWFPVSIVYRDRDVEGQRVSAGCVDCTFEAALDRMLNGTPIEWIRTGSQVILRMRADQPTHLSGTVSGLVADSLTGEALAGATVVLLRDAGVDSAVAYRWCTANAMGFYSLRTVAPGSYRLSVRALGHAPLSVSCVVDGLRPITRDLPLQQASIELAEITVEAHRTSATPAEGFARGIYIRSAPTDQNEYFLDGARIYNPAHIGGVLSTFQEEVLNDVEVTSVGIPPGYGGRIGGIIDLSLRDGSRRRIGGAVGTGSLGSHLSLEGPIDASTAFLVSLRRSYPDPMVPSLADRGAPNNLGSTEFIAKATDRLSASDRLSFSGYLGRDTYSNRVGGELSNHFRWGNSAATLRWMSVASGSLFLQSSLVYTRYDARLEHALAGRGEGPNSTYGIEDVILRAQAENYYDEAHTLRGGFEIARHRLSGTISSFDTQVAALSLDNRSAWEMSVYLQDAWRFLPRVTAELGVRATSFAGGSGTFSAIDPRIALLVDLGGTTRVAAALTAVNQFLHPYRESGVFLYYPALFWYPSQAGVDPTTSLQATLGVVTSPREGTVEVSLSSYYRLTYNLHDVPLSGASLDAADLSTALRSGTGRSYGLEFSLRKRMGDLTGSFSYALAWKDQRFGPGESGIAYAPRFDRRHEVHASLEYAPGDGWSLSALAVLASSGPSSEGAVSAAVNVEPATPAVRGFIDVNSARLPGFQRLEVRIARSMEIGDLPTLLWVRLVNGYGLLDPIDWDHRPSSDTRLMWRLRLKDLTLFPLYPAAGLSVRF